MRAYLTILHLWLMSGLECRYISLMNHPFMPSSIARPNTITTATSHINTHWTIHIEHSLNTIWTPDFMLSLSWPIKLWITNLSNHTFQTLIHTEHAMHSDIPSAKSPLCSRTQVHSLFLLHKWTLAKNFLADKVNINYRFKGPRLFLLQILHLPCSWPFSWVPATTLFLTADKEGRTLGSVWFDQHSQLHAPTTDV